MGDDENIYQFMAVRVAELEPKCHIVVMSIDTDTKMTTMRAFAGDKEMTKVFLQYFHNFLHGAISMEKSPELWETLMQGALVRGTYSLYVQDVPGISRNISAMRLRSDCRLKKVTQWVAHAAWDYTGISVSISGMKMM